MHFKCPHCQTPSFIRSSREVSRLSREAYCQCKNVFCGHTFKLMQEVVATISPSAIPDPKIAAQLEASKPKAAPTQAAPQKPYTGSDTPIYLPLPD